MEDEKKPTEWWETREGRRKRFRELLERRARGEQPANG